MKKVAELEEIRGKLKRKIDLCIIEESLWDAEMGARNLGPRNFRPGLSDRSEFPVIFRPGMRV